MRAGQHFSLFYFCNQTDGCSHCVGPSPASIACSWWSHTRWVQWMHMETSLFFLALLNFTVQVRTFFFDWVAMLHIKTASHKNNSWNILFACANKTKCVMTMNVSHSQCFTPVRQAGNQHSAYSCFRLARNISAPLLKFREIACCWMFIARC